MSADLMGEIAETVPRKLDGRHAGRLAGKVAVITGGTSGIGLAAARLFANEGARVLATGTSDESVAVARAQLGAGVEVEVVRSDAADATDVRALFGDVAARFQGLDVLFLNAGIVRNGQLTAIDEAAFDEVMRVNVKGSFLAFKYAAPLLRPGAAVVVTTSVANQLGVPGGGAYAGSSPKDVQSPGPSHRSLRHPVWPAARSWTRKSARR